MEPLLLGKLLEYERKRRNISLDKLSNGICSVVTLHRLEYGERIPSFFIVEKLLERLGKSVNKVEFLYYESDYEIIYLREQIEEKIEKKEENEVYEYLEYYRRLLDTLKLEKHLKNIHFQYLEKINAVMLLKSKKYFEAEQMLVSAIQRTIPEFEEFLEKRAYTDENQDNSIYSFLRNNIIGEEELNLILFWNREVRQRENDGYNFKEGKELLAYITEVYDDEEVYTNLYGKAAWILGIQALKEKKEKEAFWYLTEGKRILTENGLLSYLPPILEKLLFLSKRVDGEKYEEWKTERDALKLLYQEYGMQWQEEEPPLWKNYRQQEHYLLSELLGQERKLTAKSQYKLADDADVDSKTINRIEKGKYRPKPGTFRKLKEYFRIQRDMCSTRIVTEDFSLLEKERQIAKLNHYRKEKEAEKLYLVLKKELSLEWKENQQYLIYMDMLFDHQMNRITAEQALNECKRAFAVTREKLGIEQIDEIIPSRMESFIINYICKCYDILDRKKEAVHLLEKLVQGYEKSKIERKYRYAPLSLIYEHLAIDCEEVGELDRAIYWCDTAIRFDFECEKGSNLGFLLEQKTFIMERKGAKKGWCKEKYLQSYELLKLMHQRRHMELLQNYLENYDD